MVSVAAGLGLGGAQKAFQASEQLRSREGIEQSKIQEARRKQALDSADAAILSITGEIKGLAKLRAVAEPGSRELHDIDRKIDALTKQGVSVGKVYEKVGDALRGARAFDSLRTAGQSIPGLAGLRGKAAGQEGAAQIKVEAPAKAAAAGQVAAEKLKVRAAFMQQVMSGAGAPPEFSSAVATDPVTAGAIEAPLEGGGPVSEDLAQAAQGFALARAFFVAGMLPEANFQLAQANSILKNSPAIQRDQDLDKPLGRAMLQITGLQPGATLRDAMNLGVSLPSAGEESRERAIGTAQGKGQVGAQEQIGFIGEAESIIGNLLQQVKADPGLVGIRGSLRSTGQTALSVLGELGLNLFVERASDLAFSNTDMSLDEISDLFSSPTLSVLNLIENSVGLILARTRQPTGRLLASVIKLSIEDVKVTGFTGSKQVVNRLEFIRSILDKRKSALQKRFNIGGGSTTPAPQAAQPAAPNIPVFSITGGKLVPVP